MIQVMVLFVMVIQYGWLIMLLQEDFDGHLQFMAVLWIKGTFFTGVMFMH
jgi:hypothetical protein